MLRFNTFQSYLIYINRINTFLSMTFKSYSSKENLYKIHTLPKWWCQIRDVSWAREKERIYAHARVKRKEFVAPLPQTSAHFTLWSAMDIEGTTIPLLFMTTFLKVELNKYVFWMQHLKQGREENAIPKLRTFSFLHIVL